MIAITPSVKQIIVGIMNLVKRNTTPQLRATIPMVKDVYLIVFAFLFIESRFLHYQYEVAYHLIIPVSKNYRLYPLLHQ